MTLVQRVESLLSRYAVAAAVAYAACIFLFVFVLVDQVSGVWQQRDAVAAAASLLDQMQSRQLARTAAGSVSEVSIPSGSPFVEGATLSVAGAALLQRLSGAVGRVRGNVLSSQVDVQGSRSKAGFVVATSQFEIDTASLQPLLYDLEAGMPFLFVDQLSVQVPSGQAKGKNDKLRVLLSVSAQWQGAK